MKTNKTDVIIIGSGVIGVACAYYLLKEGMSVRLIEKNYVGSGSSEANCGLVSPSYALPLCRPGIISKSIKGLLLRNSPLHIKPTLELSLLKWLIKFSSKCNERDLLSAAGARTELLKQSKKLYDELFEHEDINCDWESIGHFIVFKTEREMEEYSKTNNILKQFGLEGKPYTGNEFREKEPALKSDIYGGYFYDIDAHLRPDRLMKEWKSVILQKGAAIEENCDFRSFDIAGNAVVKVKTSLGDFSAKSYIVTMGAWTPQLEKQLNLKIPIQPGKGYSITMERPKMCLKYPCSFVARKVVATPWKSGYRLGGIMEFSGYRSKLNEKRINSLISAAEEYLREPLGPGPYTKWEGLRPMTFDGLPLIGRSPNQANMFLAAGHNMLGLSMATSTGKLISEIIANRKPHLDLNPYKLTRF